MSIRYVATVLDHLPELSATETLVLVALADYASDDTRECWPNIATIARRARCDRRTAQRRLKSLEERGLIDRALGGHQYGRNTASRYRLKFDYSGQIVPDVAEVQTYPQGRQDAAPGGRRTDHPRAAGDAHKGGTSAAPSVIEPSLNQRGAKRAASKEELARAAACLSDAELEEKARTGTLTAAEEFEREHRRKTRRRSAT